MTIININGIKKTVRDGANVIITNNSIIVDGHDLSGKINGGIKVVIEGTVGNIDCEGSVDVRGDVRGAVNANGNANIGGNVLGDIQAGGNCACKSASGNISCGGNLAVGRRF